jgi:hypothetical protein
MAETTPCPGCDVRQEGKRVPSMWRTHHWKVFYICQACEQFENTKIFKKGEPLTGVGKNSTRPS